jgi:four helix bundle protein
MLAHENLDVYRRSIEFLALSSKILEGLPQGNSVLGDQLRRAALSMPLNIAEGTGKPSLSDRKRFYGIARGSAMECGAVLDACRVLALAEDGLITEGKSLLVRIVSMLTKMCR